MSIQCVMGFDYGSKRIGVAIGQTVTATARPLATVLVKNQQLDWQHISALIQEWQPDMLVVGMPTHADGSQNMTAIAAQHFTQQLQKYYQLPVDTIDERLSSVAAMEQMAWLKSGKNHRWKGKSKHLHLVRSVVPVTAAQQHSLDLDAVAAQIILETWLTECL